jgi:4-amino-4-deoxy-L-arabinose transferase-like glycosyltransferase
MDDRRSSEGATVAIRPYAFGLGLAVILILGAWLRFDGLAERDVWLDESCTFYAVHNLFDWPTDGPNPWRELAHTPYVFLLHLWTRIWGETASGMRSFSALVGCLTVLAIGLIGTRLGGRRVGLISAALAACHPLHVYYSHEARVYALWALEAAVCVYMLHGAGRTLRTRWWVAYGLLAWIIVLTHYYALLWLPATVAVILVADDRRRALRQWLVTHALLAVSLIPLVWFVILPHAEGGPKVWLREVWQDYPGVLAVPKSLWAMLPSGGYPDYLGTLHVAAEAAGDLISPVAGHLALWAPAVLVCVLLFASGVVGAGRDGRSDQPAGRGRDREAGVRLAGETLFLLCVSLLFLLVALLYSWLAGPAYVVGRYDLIAFPGLTIGVAMLIEMVTRRCRTGDWKRLLILWGTTLALSGCGLMTIFAARSVPLGHEQVERSRRIVSRVNEDDLVVSLGLYRWFMAYEWHRIGFSPRIISFPPAHDRQMCWDNAEAELADAEQIAADVAQVAHAIEQALTDGTQVWLLAHGEPTGPRWEVDRRFYARLRELNIEARLADEWLGLAELVREPEDATAPHDSDDR